MPSIKVRNEIEFFGKGFEKVGCGITVVVIASSSLSHFDHQFFVEVAPQAIRRGGYALLGSMGAKSCNFIRIRRLANISIAVGEKDDTRNSCLFDVFENCRRSSLPAAMKIR